MRRGFVPFSKIVIALFLLIISQGTAVAEQPVASEVVAGAASPIGQALLDIKSEDAAVRSAAAALLIEKGDASLLSALDAIRAEADRATRQAIKPVIDLLKNHANLTSDQSDTRRSAAADLVGTGRPEAIVWLEEAAAKEPVWWVKYTMEESAQLLRLRAEDHTVRVVAVKKLGELRSQNGLSALKELVEAGSQSGATDEQRALADAAHASIGQIDAWFWWADAIETFFRGISLSSILLMMSLGLAIVFGLMGVINMAHGELMMIGAYATFVTQQAFIAWVSPEMFDWYFPVALPVAFLVAAAFGWLLEATVVRFLYGRLLETLLATWGVSLILMQAARVYFGDLTAVIAPQALRGGAQVMVGVYLPYNRIFIILLSIVCVLGIYFLLFRSNLGIRVRSVTQNRNMSACLGIPTRKVDSYTFAFASGLAGIAGWALTMVGNVDPGLGQNYIVDAFMVVVTGGVGKLAGTIWASLGIGGLNKLIEPVTGAVYGKVFILVGVILFLQWRPQGLFAAKGRSADA
ncbi:MAG: urea ABC transporter permease subunit UrtB [Nitrospira sp.]|nr:urea ABC transporter permease subunit UrtB [Nitrospira sp.]MDH5334940.1 urea ABC transporter permease subunit UrtB [Nitrospira sp.]